MSDAILTAFISSAALIVVAVIQFWNVRDRKRSERRADRRAEESRLSMSLMGASAKLSMVCAKKLTNREVNGDVQVAMDEAKDALEEYEEFKDKIAAASVAKV